MKPVEQTAAFAALTEQNVPPAKAVVKIVSTRRGWFFVVAGAVLIAASFAFVIWTMIATKAAPPVALLVFAALPGLPGFYFVLAGGHIISAEAMNAAEASGGIIAKTAARVLNAARAGITSTPSGGVS